MCRPGEGGMLLSQLDAPNCARKVDPCSFIKVMEDWRNFALKIFL
jgi:hypothetical protein